MGYYNADLIRHKEDILGRIVWSELENTRHRLNRKMQRLTSNYMEYDVIKCADSEFEKRVKNRATQEIAHCVLFGKRINAKRIVKKAIRYELCVLYGKEA